MPSFRIVISSESRYAAPPPRQVAPVVMAIADSPWSEIDTGGCPDAVRPSPAEIGVVVKKALKVFGVVIIEPRLPRLKEAW